MGCGLKNKGIKGDNLCLYVGFRSCRCINIMLYPSIVNPKGLV
jgi:hypothetical protein